MLLHEKIRAIRIQKGYSRRKLADLTDSTATHIYYIEKHKRPNPRLISIVKIAKALGLTMDELLAGTEFDGSK